jgi:hypothetical protein
VSFGADIESLSMLWSRQRNNGRAFVLSCFYEV